MRDYFRTVISEPYYHQLKHTFKNRRATKIESKARLESIFSRKKTFGIPIYHQLPHDKNKRTKSSNEISNHIIGFFKSTTNHCPQTNTLRGKFTKTSLG